MIKECTLRVWNYKHNVTWNSRGRYILNIYFLHYNRELGDLIGHNLKKGSNLDIWLGPWMLCMIRLFSFNICGYLEKKIKKFSLKNIF